jgi:hypothetical protein
MSTSGLRAFGSLFASFPFVIKTSMPHLAPIVQPMATTRLAGVKFPPLRSAPTICASLGFEEVCNALELLMYTIDVKKVLLCKDGD